MVVSLGTISPGDTLGKYTIEAYVGGGGFGRVYRAIQGGPAGFSRPVAIKVLRPGARSSDGSVQAFAREARTIARLQHRNIVQLYEFASEQDLYFMVMEFIDGVTLDRISRGPGEKPPLWLSLVIGQEVCRGLMYAHNLRDDEGKLLGIVHRDVKPSNILLSRQGDVKLMDFGLAKMSLVDSEQFTDAGVIKGTPAYMSPEQWRGHGATAASDVFSLAALLYELCTGKQMTVLSKRGAAGVERFAPPSSYAPGMPALVDDLLLRALQPDPAKRPSASELLDGLASGVVAIAPSDLLSRQGQELAELVKRLPPVEPEEPPAMPAAPVAAATRSLVPDAKLRAFMPQAVATQGAMPAAELPGMGAFAPRLVSDPAPRASSNPGQPSPALPSPPAPSSEHPSPELPQPDRPEETSDSLEALTRPDGVHSGPMQPQARDRPLGVSGSRASPASVEEDDALDDGTTLIQEPQMVVEQMVRRRRRQIWLLAGGGVGLLGIVSAVIIWVIVSDHSGSSMSGPDEPSVSRASGTGVGSAQGSETGSVRTPYSGAPAAGVGSDEEPAHETTVKVKKAPKVKRTSGLGGQTGGLVPPAAMGILFVNTKPWSRVYVDDKLVGDVPVLNLKIASGVHRLRMVTGSGKEYRRKVTVAPGPTPTRKLYDFSSQ